VQQSTIASVSTSRDPIRIFTTVNIDRGRYVWKDRAG
jgi:hypothetical protein